MSVSEEEDIEELLEEDAEAEAEELLEEDEELLEEEEELLEEEEELVGGKTPLLDDAELADVEEELVGGEDDPAGTLLVGPEQGTPTQSRGGSGVRGQATSVSSKQSAMPGLAVRHP